MKKLLASILAIIMLATCVTAISAMGCPYVSCDGIMYNADCAAKSLDDCELYERSCSVHSNCIYQEYFAQTKSVCNVCGFWMYIEGNAHLCAIGHRYVGQGYAYEMESVCVYY